MRFVNLWNCEFSTFYLPASSLPLHLNMGSWVGGVHFWKTPARGWFTPKQVHGSLSFDATHHPCAMCTTFASTKQHQFMNISELSELLLLSLHKNWHDFFSLLFRGPKWWQNIYISKWRRKMSRYQMLSDTIQLEGRARHFWTKHRWRWERVLYCDALHSEFNSLTWLSAVIIWSTKYQCVMSKMNYNAVS